MYRLTAFLFAFSAFFTAFSQTLDGAERSSVDEQYEPFYHGVASGDPLSDRIILWTRITTSNFNDTVGWEIATDREFTNIVNSGTEYTDTSRDFTVKVDAAGLSPNTWYYYRFSGHGNYSVMGRTRTAPVANVDNLRFAIASCSKMDNGFFNGYRDIINRNDVDAVIHVGDYIYDGGGTFYDTSRNAQPNREINTLADYRMRHSQYKLDEDLREAHRQFPWIIVWDDHDICSNAWMEGADPNYYNPVTDGSWDVRKAAARKAFFEWTPVRESTFNNDSIIYRTIHYGNLVDMIMIDTRLIGRDEQATTDGETDSISDPVLQDTARTILGAAQREWLFNELNTSAAKWKIVGNQVMIATVPIGTIVTNTDSWDGYPYDRKRVFKNIMQNDVKNVVFVTGDIHSSWSADLPYDSSYNAATGAGSVGVEFVCTSITTGGSTFPPDVIMNLDPHIKYVNFSQHGYILLDLTNERAQADHINVSTTQSRTFDVAVTGSKFVNNNERFLRSADAPIQPRTLSANLAPEYSGIYDVKNNIVSLSCFPNPFDRTVSVQYYLHKAENVVVKLTDINGRKVFEQKLDENTAGLHSSVIQLPELSSGVYTLQFVSKTGISSVKIAKR